MWIIPDFQSLHILEIHAAFSSGYRLSYSDIPNGKEAQKLFF
jgi:hypothetical protein